MSQDSLYYVAIASGFLVLEGDSYRVTHNPRRATPFPAFYTADRAAKDAVMDLLATEDLKPWQQYFAIFQPAFK